MWRSVRLGDGETEFTDREQLSFWSSAWRVMGRVPEQYLEVHCQPAYTLEAGKPVDYVGPEWTFLRVDRTGKEWGTSMVVPFWAVETGQGLREALDCVDAAFLEVGIEVHG